MDKFLKFIDVDSTGPINNDTIHCCVSVSATPMSENHPSNASEEKVIVKLEPGNGYKSMQYMLNDGNIKQSGVLNKSCTKFISTEYMENKLRDYVVIRWRNKPEIIINNIIISINKLENKNNIDINYSFVSCQSEKATKITYNDEPITNYIKPSEIFDIEPENLTFVFVKDFLRLGEQVNTKYISIMHENGITKVDTMAQSFAGRACGYNKLLHNVTVYTSAKAIQDYIDWYEKLNNHIPIATNIKNGFNIQFEIETPGLIAQCPILLQIIRHPKNINKMKNHLHNCKECNVCEMLSETQFIIHYEFNANGRQKILEEAYNAIDNKKQYFHNFDDTNNECQVLLDDENANIIIMRKHRIELTSKTTGKERFNHTNNQTKSNNNKIDTESDNSVSDDMNIIYNDTVTIKSKSFVKKIKNKKLIEYEIYE